MVPVVLCRQTILKVLNVPAVTVAVSSVFTVTVSTRSLFWRSFGRSSDGRALVGIDDAALLAGWAAVVWVPVGAVPLAGWATVVWELVGAVPLAGWATGVWVLLQPGRIKRMAMPESKKRRDIGCPRK